MSLLFFFGYFIPKNVFWHFCNHTTTLYNQNISWNVSPSTNNNKPRSADHWDQSVKNTDPKYYSNHPTFVQHSAIDTTLKSAKLASKPVTDLFAVPAQIVVQALIGFLAFDGATKKSPATSANPHSKIGYCRRFIFTNNTQRWLQGSLQSALLWTVN